jgi:hypothetical protein
MARVEEEAGERGRASASARAEYERRQARDESRRRSVFGPLAPLVRLIAGPKPSTEAWGRGAAGEERVGDWLDEAVRWRGVVLHDRALPHGRANIEHLAVVASGIWVIDTKHFRGRLERRDIAGWLAPAPALRGGSRPEPPADLGAPAKAQVAEEPAGGPPVRVPLYFTGALVGLFARPCTLEGVLVTWPRAFAGALARAGPVGPAERRAFAARLARAFPPYSG